MGQFLTKAEFDIVTAPVLAKKQDPPQWFKPQKLVETFPNIGTITTAFLNDGTIAGTVQWGEQQLSLRGVFFVIPSDTNDTSSIVTEVELSLHQPTRHHHHNQHSATRANRLIINPNVDGGLLQRRASSTSTSAAEDEDAFQVEFIGEEQTATDFLPTATTDEKREGGGRRVVVASDSAAAVAMAIAMSAINITEQAAENEHHHDHHHHHHGDGSDGSGAGNKMEKGVVAKSLTPSAIPEELSMLTHGSASTQAAEYTTAMLMTSSLQQLPPQIMSMIEEQKRQRAREQQQQEEEEEEDEELLLLAGSGGGGTSPPGATGETTPSPQQRSTSSGITRLRKKQRSLFDRMGRTYQIPTDEDGLRALFASFDVNASGFISRAELVKEYKAFEEELGLSVSDRDIDAVFKKFDKNMDSKLSFAEFSMFLLHRAKC